MALNLKLTALQKTYADASPGDAVRVLEPMNCLIERGQFVSIVGPSGCGKTTLLRIIAGLEKPTAGHIFMDGKKITGRDPRVGMVFQEYALFPWRKLIQNIEVGLEIKGTPAAIRRAEAMKYVRAFGLEGFEGKYPKELSGGMKQRVAIARTLIANPQIVLMDEPFGSLDSQTRNRLQDFLLGIWQERRDTVLFVTHNVDEAVYLSDRIIVLSKRPAQIVEIIDVPLERPRDRTGREVNRIRKSVLDLIQ